MTFTVDSLCSPAAARYVFALCPRDVAPAQRIARTPCLEHSLGRFGEATPKRLKQSLERRLYCSGRKFETRRAVALIARQLRDAHRHVHADSQHSPALLRATL